MRHTSAGCGIGSTDLVACVTSLDWHTSGFKGPSPLALTIFGGAMFISWHLRRPLFKGMLTVLEAFLEPPGGSELQPYARTHLKNALRPTRLLVGRGPNTFYLIRWSQLLGYISLDAVVSQGCLARVPERTSICVTRSQLALLEPQGTVSQALTLLGGAWFIAWRLSPLFLRECRQGPRHFWECRAYLCCGPALRTHL